MCNCKRAVAFDWGILAVWDAEDAGGDGELGVKERLAVGVKVNVEVRAEEVVEAADSADSDVSRGKENEGSAKDSSVRTVGEEDSAGGGPFG